MGSALAWAERRMEYFRRPPPRPDIANHDELGLTICIVMSAVVSCTSMGAGSEFREHLFLAQIQCHYLPQHAPACCMHSAQGCLFSSTAAACSPVRYCNTQTAFYAVSRVCLLFASSICAEQPRSRTFYANTDTFCASFSPGQRGPHSVQPYGGPQ